MTNNNNRCHLCNYAYLGSCDDCDLTDCGNHTENEYRLIYRAAVEAGDVGTSNRVQMTLVANNNTN